MKVDVNHAEQQFAITIALMRHEANRSAGKQNQRVGNQQDWLTDLDGVGGEIAACKLFNAYPDSDIAGVESSPRHDFITSKGLRVDVKTTAYESGKLLARTCKSKDDCDIYLLMVGRFPSYEAKGWVYSDQLLDENNLTDLGYGKTYALDQNQLNKTFKETNNV